MAQSTTSGASRGWNAPLGRQVRNVFDCEPMYANTSDPGATLGTINSQPLHVAERTKIPFACIGPRRVAHGSAGQAG